MKLNLIITGGAWLASALALSTSTTTELAFLVHERAQHKSLELIGLVERKGGGHGGGKGGSSKKGSSDKEGSATGGRTTTGSGVAASYGGGRYYGGGTTVPFRAGAMSSSGIQPIFFDTSSLAFWPGTWHHPIYLYAYRDPWTYRNETRKSNETKPVKCGCDAYQECGCDNNNSTDFINSVLGTATYSQLNNTLVTVALVNGTNTILLNGTLPNGTTASGGTVSPNGGTSTGKLVAMAKSWVAATAVIAIVFCCV